MKKVFFLFVLFLSGLSTGCQTELSSSVDQDRIFTAYELYYDRNSDITTARAVFRFGNLTGTQLQLAAPAEVRFNNDVLAYNSVLGFYERDYSGFLTGGTFVYRDVNNRSFTNTIAGLKIIDFPASFPTNFGRSNSFTLTWAGEPLGTNERLDVLLTSSNITEPQLFIQPGAGSTNIVLAADQLTRLAVGQGNASLFRYLVLPLQQATSAGGSISGRYQPMNKTISIQ
jgi:hypothetical protein